jgi:hypothetical protein
LSDFVQHGSQSERFYPQGLESRGQLGKACNSGAGSKLRVSAPVGRSARDDWARVVNSRAGRGAFAPRFDHSLPGGTTNTTGSNMQGYQ